MINRPMYHKTILHRPCKMMRGDSGAYGVVMPNARPMREPQTNYLTYITAEGPITYQPGA